MAQVCQEPGLPNGLQTQKNTAKLPPGQTSTSANTPNYITCDMTQRDIITTCDNTLTPGNPGVRGSCPNKPMPMLSTPDKSFIATYSPYLYAYPRAQNDKTRPYDGVYSTGTSGGSDRVFGMIGKQGVGSKRRMSSCVDQIQLTTLPTPPSNAQEADKQLREQAMHHRLQLDNCTNQYILRSALYPFNKSNSRMINDAAKPRKYVTLATECQYLKVYPTPELEYNPAFYLAVAWKKTLIDPKFQENTSLIKSGMVSTLLGMVGVDIPNVITNASEPQMPLPKTMTLRDPIPLPSTLENQYRDPNDPNNNKRYKLTLKQIAATPYEEILDPTHPFSPRWDYLYSDRDLSPMTSTYMSKTKNSVFCAGVREASNNTTTLNSKTGKQNKTLTAKEKEDMEVRVDVLNFRRAAWEEGIFRRMAFNTMCFLDRNESKDKLLLISAISYCYNVSVWELAGCLADPHYCPEVKAKRINCHKCFGLKKGKKTTGDGSDTPPCSTNYIQQDREIVYNGWFASLFSGLIVSGNLNGADDRAICDPIPSLVPEKLTYKPPFVIFFSRKPKYDITNLCSAIRKPFTPINKLKMRYHNPDDKENIVLKDGVPEGYAFSGYFNNRMPYPRLLDTGMSLQKEAVSDINYQLPTDTTGQFTTIVGVGREAAPTSIKKDANNKNPSDIHKDERCRWGGWGGIAGQYTAFLGKELPAMTVMGKIFPLPDPMTSWTELKLYQTHSMRYGNMVCLGRYEKMFKPGAGENVILAAAGGEWSRVIVQICPKQSSGKSKCTSMTIQEYKKYLEKNGGKVEEGKTVMMQMKKEGFPLGWRGYMAAGTGAIDFGLTNMTQFPKFGNSTGAASIANRNLDNVTLGDILVFPRGMAPDGPLDKPGLPSIALVIETRLPDKTDCETEKSCYVQILEANNGKWPDTCGITDTWGQTKTRYLYKPGHLPKDAKNEYTRIKASGSCLDSKLAYCELDSWSTTSYYRPRSLLNTQLGCRGKANVSECD